MLTISLRDLQFRRRRFVVGVLGAALVLGITLLLTGIPASFDNEARRTIDAFHGEDWVVPDGVTGPFLSSASFPATVAAEVAATAGVEVAPIAILHGVLGPDGSHKQVNIHGIPLGSFAQPEVRSGRVPLGAGELVVDGITGYDVDDEVVLNGRNFTVVGRTSGLSYNAGLATISMLLTDAQSLGFGGADLATAIVAAGHVPTAPAGYAVVTTDEAFDDMVQPLASPKQTIVAMQWLLWIVTTMIVGSVVYLSALDRLRDFAVFKAMGADDRSIIGGLVLQSLLLCAIAYVAALGLARFIDPVVPIQSEVPRFAYVGLAAVAVAIGLVASLVGARRALSVDPALAFGGS